MVLHRVLFFLGQRVEAIVDIITRLLRRRHFGDPTQESRLTSRQRSILVQDPYVRVIGLSSRTTGRCLKGRRGQSHSVSHSGQTRHLQGSRSDRIHRRQHYPRSTPPHTRRLTPRSSGNVPRPSRRGQLRPQRDR